LVARFFFLIPKNFQKKFENNGLPGIFLGYCKNSNASKIFDITNNKVIISRTVNFFEHLPANFYFNNTISNIPDDQNIIINDTQYNNTNINNNHNLTTMNSNTNTFDNSINNSISNYQFQNTPHSDNSNNIPNTTIPNSITNTYTDINNNNNNTSNFNHNNGNNSYSFYNSFIDNNYILNNSKRKQSSNDNYNNNKKRKSNRNTRNKIKNYDKSKLREPTSFDDIQNLIDKDEWMEAVKEELRNMTNLKVYCTIKNLPSNANLITTKWVFKYKRDSNGKIIKRKARLVARGYTQKPGTDFQNTFAPTLKQDSLRIFTAISVNMNFKIKQIDINSAYLNAPLKEEIYLEAPIGHKSYQKHFWKLNKALYGLRQSANAWNEELNKILININFIRLHSDPCIYKRINNRNIITCLLAVYVDDIIIAGTDAEIENTINLIKNEFKIKEIGDVDFIIGIKFIKITNGYILHQKRYISDLLNKYDNYLSGISTFIKLIQNEEFKTIKVDPTQYRSLIGNLLYIAISTRPDILFAVTKSARKSNNPNKEDWINLIKILEYLKGTINYCLKFKKSSYTYAYSDADFGGDNETRKSTTGFLLKIGNTPVSWCSKLQHCVATSTCEAEYYSISECAKHCTWATNILNELNIKIKTINIYTDNKAAIHVCNNNVINPKNKHIDIRFHYIKELIKNNKIKLTYIKSKMNLADGLTKYLDKNKMEQFRNNLLFEIN